MESATLACPESKSEPSDQPRVESHLLVIMHEYASEDELRDIAALAVTNGLAVDVSIGTDRAIIGVRGDLTGIRRKMLSSLPGVERVERAEGSFPLVRREVQPEGSRVRFGEFEFGAGPVGVIAGPCTVESRDQMLRTAEAVKAAGAIGLRGGAFKPRTSPYAFQGLGEEGLKLLAEAGKATDLPICTEVMDVGEVELVAHYSDMLQIGARNMQHFRLLEAVGRVHKPVLLKRGLSATVDELLQCAEYIAKAGNKAVILCERGIRTFESHTRNTLSLGAVAHLKTQTHLPVVVDPSHATGVADLVEPTSLGAIAVGADGLLIETHHAPEEALIDGPQSLTSEAFDDLMKKAARIAGAVGRDM